MIEDLAAAIATTVGQVPAAVWVVLLLAGPTLGWVAYTSAVSRRSAGSEARRSGAISIEAEYWQCPECLSLTPVSQASCYACGFRPGRDDVDVDERIPIPEPVPAGATGAGDDDGAADEADRRSA